MALKEFSMAASIRRDPASVYANVGVHTGVEITLALDAQDGEAAAIKFGHTGPELIVDFADVDSLERLSAVAADGARRLRERIEANAAGHPQQA
jgi:hypothetical protein